MDEDITSYDYCEPTVSQITGVSGSGNGESSKLAKVKEEVQVKEETMDELDDDDSDSDLEEDSDEEHSITTEDPNPEDYLKISFQEEMEEQITDYAGSTAVTKGTLATHPIRPGTSLRKSAMLPHVTDDADPLAFTEHDPASPISAQKDSGGASTSRLDVGASDMKKSTVCPICQKSVCNSVYLKMHISTVHQKEKPYSCAECKESFAWPGYLKNHMRAIHGKQDIYVCSQCDVTFDQAADLKGHIRLVHDGQKLHVCPHCCKTFNHTRDLKRHISTVHEGQKPFPCTQCDM